MAFADVAIANGDYLLLILGLALSIPLIVFGSNLLLGIMDKYPIVIYIGAALIAWTAGEMMLSDGKIGPLLKDFIPGRIIPAIITIAVLGMGLRAKYARKSKQDTAKQSGDSQSF